jgi:hypothetical protein
MLCSIYEAKLGKAFLTHLGGDDGTLVYHRRNIRRPAFAINEPCPSACMVAQAVSKVRSPQETSIFSDNHLRDNS